MEDYKKKIAGICCFNVKNDPLLRGFGKLFGESVLESVEGYSEIAGALALKGQPLGDYLHDMLVFSDSPILAECAKNLTEPRRDAVERDVVVIAEIAETVSRELRSKLSAKYPDFDFMSLPYFDTGGFNYTAEYFIHYVKVHGSGIFAKYRAFTFDGELLPVESTDPIRLTDLKNYEEQRRQVVDNTLCFLRGKPAQNVLLYGDRGTGKSSTVKAVLNEFDELRMVEVSKSDVAVLPVLFRRLRDIPLKFIITIDDLVFNENDDRFGILKAALEGSLSAKPDNILIYATTNRRKLIRETAADREISGADAIDESMSLADRFGLFITFMRPDKQMFMDIVGKLAADKGLTVPEDRLTVAAERFALRHGGRSPRTARQFVDWLDGRISLDLEY
ncbi:MAG: ATP-binding protein [Oscillospiraceae bacterium]|nr:ATP-binding protein [Oscillospiraceae bacterium]